MILPAFTDNFRKFAKLALIIIIALSLRISKIEAAFPFDFDQQVPAATAYDFFVNHKITLIGQELSFPGFFIGPLYNWVQFIPYGLCNLAPDCIPYFSIILGLLSIGLLFLVLKKIFDAKTALIASSIYAFSFAAISHEIGINGNSFLFLSSIGLLFFLWKYFSGEDKYFLAGVFLAGIITVNFNPIFILSTAAFSLSGLMRRNKSLPLFFVAPFTFLVNYIPLMIFNSRHDNIILKGLQNFITESPTTSDYLERSVFLLKRVAIPFYSNYLFQSVNLIFILATIFLIIFGFYALLKTKERFLLFLPIWIATTVLGLVFYKGHIPDYYFQQTLLAFIILVAFALRQSLVIFVLFTIVFLFTNINTAVNYKTPINYRIKKEAVNYIINDSAGESFNVYYDMPPGINTGYSYLFKIKEKEPQEGGKNLYILEFSDPTQFTSYKYHKSFPDKKISVKVTGFVHIVSVK
ncbi:hypothetical protein A2697_01045 [Candidatus Curtissbacteria bacterium RIFCSPHIGHO2_01_FULL_41_44]|uniref:Glycosyltransferase RgtA/B/C/D-like domain-containing protein n=1 Tax=Candidatus Curtissbacteria bacterium RIFCSPLOWO2_01_FULL_42_50 TaxID=1797730 RepID=A0A1F5H2V2_9BACT|nr:MAG: hypothetical protein A3C33_02345 [Candidatus Curtissbacteria bacterium RIFCSPHIGHO2_02_FULL_42_58]OGD94836.1 MAG: hypothetical protein A2697_01045 [Candidatus Curtissbacteria bacterium RIFCSPHIGHO2_01_FULL_41_44]OGD98463.1 MAG: hypothetical protein A3B54_04325 [Candidatus Curtissbacteria bacterium RIFCSPLOWO2_01_FULL_42_50]